MYRQLEQLLKIYIPGTVILTRVKCIKKKKFFFFLAANSPRGKLISSPIFCVSVPLILEVSIIVICFLYMVSVALKSLGILCAMLSWSDRVPVVASVLRYKVCFI